jgi:hypothetical protein
MLGMENTKELNTFEKLIVKIQTGDWDDLAYLEMTLEKNFSLLKNPTKNDIRVHEKLMDLISERKTSFFGFEGIMNVHRKEIKSIVPHKGSFEAFSDDF